MGIGTVAKTYGSFLFGTGQTTVSNALKTSIKAAKGSGATGYGKAVYDGFKTGMKATYQAQKNSGGYLKSLKAAFGNIPTAWKSGKGLGKLSGVGKAISKTFPALLAVAVLAGEVPNIVKATKEKGIGQGLKEVGKSAVKLTLGSIGGVLGGMIPGLSFIGGIAGYSAGIALGNLLVGKSYSEKQAEQQEQGITPYANNNQGNNTGIATGTENGNRNGSSFNIIDTPMTLPPVDINDYAPDRFLAAQKDIGLYNQNNTVGSNLNIVSQ